MDVARGTMTLVEDEVVVGMTDAEVGETTGVVGSRTTATEVAVVGTAAGAGVTVVGWDTGTRTDGVDCTAAEHIGMSVTPTY